MLESYLVPENRLDERQLTACPQATLAAGSAKATCIVSVLSRTKTRDRCVDQARSFEPGLRSLGSQPRGENLMLFVFLFFLSGPFLQMETVSLASSRCKSRSKAHSLTHPRASRFRLLAPADVAVCRRHRTRNRRARWRGRAGRCIDPAAHAASVP